jgi:hypothetical protein
VAAEEAGSKLVKIRSKKDYDSLISSGECSPPSAIYYCRDGWMSRAPAPSASTPACHGEACLPF